MYKCDSTVPRAGQLPGAESVDMKLPEFTLAASFLVAVAGIPRDKATWQLHPSPVKISHTAAFGGTFNYAKKHEGNIHGSVSDHSKYEVYEPQEHTYGGKGGAVHEGPSKGSQYYGTYGTGAQKGYGKGTYEHPDGGYKKESGYLGGHIGYGSHGSLGHSEGKYGYQTSVGKEENRGVGYEVTEEHSEHVPKVTSNTGGYIKPYDLAWGGEKKEVTGVSEGLGDFASVLHESQEPKNVRDYNSGHRQDHGEHQAAQAIDHFGPRKETGALGSYTSMKHEGHKYQESRPAGEYEVHETQHSDGPEVSGDHGNYGKYAKGDHVEVNHGGKLSSSVGEYYTSRDHDYKAHRRTHGEEGNSEKETTRGLGDYASGTYDARNDGSEVGSDKKKFGSGY